MALEALKDLLVQGSAMRDTIDSRID